MTANQQMPLKAGRTAGVGVLLYDTTVAVDAILIAAVELVRARNIAVGGLLQRIGERLPDGRHSMWLEDIATGRTIRLDRPRGRGARACILDPDALAQAASLLRRAVELKPGLIIVNRFGRAETMGGGMRAEIADAILSGAAVLIAVRYSLLDDLEGFLGESASLLLPSPAAIADWAEHAAAIRQPANAEDRSDGGCIPETGENP